jgi:TRAP transporter TAXI family solute receptor
MRGKGFSSITSLAVFLLAAWAVSASGAEQQLVGFASPAAGGLSYVTVAGMVNTVNRYMPGNVKFVHEATTGTLDMVRRLQMAYSQKKEMMAAFGTPDGWNAYKGEAEYKGRGFAQLRAVIFNHVVDLYLAVPANSPIKSYADIKGKRIGMGGPGSSPANLGHLILEYYGVAKKDFKPFYYVYKETVEGIQDGSLDGGFLAGGYPMPSYLELSTRFNARIVPVEEKIATKIIADHPGHYQNVVKAKSYKGLEQDTRILGWTSAVWTHSGVSNDLIYTFLKTLFDHKEEYYQIHQDARGLTLENATKTILVPFHPGAEKYLKEMGAIK